MLSGGDSVILYAMTGRANTAAAADLATTRGGGGSGGHDMGMAALGESVLWSNACIEVEDKKLGTKYVLRILTALHSLYSHCTLIALTQPASTILLYGSALSPCWVLPCEALATTLHRHWTATREPHTATPPPCGSWCCTQAEPAHVAPPFALVIASECTIPPLAGECARLCESRGSRGGQKLPQGGCSSH